MSVLFGKSPLNEWVSQRSYIVLAMDFKEYLSYSDNNTKRDNCTYPVLSYTCCVSIKRWYHWQGRYTNKMDWSCRQYRISLGCTKVGGKKLEITES